MRIQHNIMAMSAYRNYTNNVAAMKKNLEKLSSGYKINRAGDDAAGLAISEKMRAQITGLETAQKNAKDGISLVQTAEGALTEVHDMLNRMVELATQSANGTYDNTTDRAQMQKEVNQLLDEINRIADSSNFNGINLLDGTLGLNTDAFSITAGDQFTEAVAATTGPATLADYHGGEGASAVAPSFSIDLNDLEISNTATTKATVSFTFNFGGQNYSASVASVAAGSSVTATQAAAAIASALATATFGDSTTKGMTIGGLAMKVAAAGNKVNFTYYNVVASATATDANGTKIVDGKASTFNAALGGTVTITAGTNGKLKDGTQYICDVTAVKNAVDNNPARRPGATVDLTNLVKDGGKLTIANGTGSTASKTTYIFKTDKDSEFTSSTNTIVIDVSMHATTDQARMAAMIMAGGVATKTVNSSSVPTGNANGSAQTAAGGKFTVSLGTGAKVHFDIASAADASIGNTEEKMKKLITVTTPAQAEKLASTKLTVDEGALRDGNVISVGDKKFVYNGTGSNAFTDAADLASKLTAAGYTTTVSTNSNGQKVLNIQGKKTDSEGNTIESKNVVAPTVLGKGLTLQIGDTADSYNQLNVAVQDMHAANLGIGGLDISTEEAAQAATDKIKAAINTVSDVRGTLGATQNRLDHTINNLSVMTENIQDAESTIRDVDVAEEMMAYTKNNILIQSAQAMLAQANQVPQGVLQLLQ